MHMSSSLGQNSFVSNIIFYLEVKRVQFGPLHVAPKQTKSGEKFFLKFISSRDKDLQKVIKTRPG